MVKYRILWESLKETADHMASIEGFDDLKWSVLSKMMKDGEEMFESGELSKYPPGYDYEVWVSGATSVTAEGDTERWKHCELVEEV